MKIRPVGAELFYTDGQTEGQSVWQENMTKLIIAYHNFVDTRISDEYIHALSRYDGYCVRNVP